MKIINCPLNGPRNAQEFVCGGEVKLPPAQHNPCDEENNRQWVEYVFMEENPQGVTREWWCHVASAYWFIVERDTGTDEILRTCPASELYQKQVADNT